MRFRQNPAAVAAANDAVLDPGEPGYETDTGVFKIGDGSAPWSELPLALSGRYVPATVITGTGIDPTGVADSTAAIQALIDAMPVLGGTMCLPPGTYKVTSTLDFGLRPGIELIGSGRPGQHDESSNSTTTIVYSGTGPAIKWAVGALSAQFSGITLKNLRVLRSGTSPAGGIHLGNASNCLLRDLLVAEFDTPGMYGIRVGDPTGTEGAQYNVLDNVWVANCATGMLFHSGGPMLMGGVLEGSMPTPVAGTVGIDVQGGAGCSFVGTVIQGFSTLISVGEYVSDSSWTNIRCEGFDTAYVVAGPRTSILGGSINNNINGSTGTGISLTATATASMCIVPGVSAVATALSDLSDGSTVLLNGASWGSGSIAQNVARLTASELIVDKRGVGAQDPVLTLQSNGVAGPTLKTEETFTVGVLDHTHSSATRMSLRLRGVEVARLSVGGHLLLPGHLGVGNSAAATTPGSVVRKIEIFDSAGSSLGFVPVYNAIT